MYVSYAKIIRCLDPYKFIMVHRGKERRRLLLSIFPCKLGSGKTRRKEDMKEEPTKIFQWKDEDYPKLLLHLQMEGQQQR